MTIGTTPVELVDLEPPEPGERDDAGEQAPSSNGDSGETAASRSASRAHSHHGALHAAIDEDDPAPQGAEIR